MGVIKDIIERRVNTTGVSEPVVVVQGSDRVVDRAARRVRRRRRAPPRRPDRAARLRAARHDAGDGRPGARPRERVPAAVQRRPDHIRGGRHRTTTAASPSTSSSRTTARSSAAQTVRQVHRATTSREYFAITLDERVISAPVIEDADPERSGPDHRRRARRLPGRRGERARHGPQVRLAAVPDPGAVERADLGHARRAVPQPEPAAPASSASPWSSLFMLLYYRLPGLVAAFALIYYTIVVSRSSGSSR